MILCNDIEPKARKKVKRPRACMAVSFITTSVMLSMGASVESVYQPTWSALGLDGSHSNRTTTTNDVVINGSNGKKHDSPQSSVKSEDSSHNNHHKVVRRPRRDEGDSRIEVDGHTDHLRDESTSKGKAKMRSETANNDSVSESPQISLDLPEQKKSQASVDPGKSRQERRTHPANSSHGTIDQDFKIGLFPYEIP